MPDNKLTDAFICFCAAISPFTSKEEILQLKQKAVCDDVDWAAVARHTNAAGLAPALHKALESKGLAVFAPETFVAYLDEIYRFNLARNKALLKQQLELVQLMNGIGITPLLLKGGAALATELYADPGIRFMWDLDLLVPEEKLEAAVAVLLDKGYLDKYSAGFNNADNHHHPGLVYPGAPAKVELHRRVLRRDLKLLEPEEIWERSRPYTGTHLPGASALLMSPTDEAIYCFAHSELAHNHHLYERVDARHLQEFAHICDRHREEIDWNRVELLKQHPAYGNTFCAYLYLARELFHINLPVTANLGREAERHYRRVTVWQSGWKTRSHLLKILFLELHLVFATERLQRLYPQERSPFRLRLRHLRFLLGRYCHLEAWRTRLKGLQPF